METESEKMLTSPDTLIEAKLSRVSKAFSIENLIAKKVESEQGNFSHHSKIPPITFPQNFPFYNPWAANYLMSHPNLSQNILQLNSNPTTQQLQQQLQHDKLGNLVVAESQGFAYKDLLLNPLLNLSPDHSSTYQHHHHNIPQDPAVFANKLKDTQFLNEFYTNYFMLENNRHLLNTNTSSLSSSDNNNVKRTKKDYVMSENCNNDSNNSSSGDFDVVNDRDKVEHKSGSGIYYEEDSSYSDLSVTLSPDQVHKNQDKGNNNFHSSYFN